MKRAVEELKTGDKVVVRHSSTWDNHHPYEIHTVTRITKTQITLDNGERYMKKYGRRVGDSDSWHPKVLMRHLSVEEAMTRNAAIEAESYRLSIAAELSRFNKWRTLPLDTLLSIQAMLKEA